MLLPMKVADIFGPRDVMSQIAVFMLLGIHSTKYPLFLFWTLSTYSFTSFMDTWPLEHCDHCQLAAVAGVAGGHHVLSIKHLLGEFGHFEGPILLVAMAGKGAKPDMKKCRWGKGTMFTASAGQH